MRNGSDNAKLEKLQTELKKAKTQKAKLLARNKISALKSRIKKRECKEYIYQLIEKQTRRIAQLEAALGEAQIQSMGCQGYDMDQVK